jgi:glycosyltransferase involved in cell wall biosynthesis
MGYQEDIYKYITDASCIVLPSYREGMSTVLLEASVHKRPIITTRVPGCEDIIKNSSYGILCEPRDYKSLLQAIQKFIKLDHLEISMMVEKTFDHVRKNFSKESVLMNYKSSISDIK